VIAIKNAKADQELLWAVGGITRTVVTVRVEMGNGETEELVLEKFPVNPLLMVAGAVYKIRHNENSLVYDRKAELKISAFVHVCEEVAAELCHLPQERKS
jgi:hypothetical protein